ncbi:MAG: CoA transferase [Euryarchaeota archaeon]|nr:CoA transferase [Euryarchaeota archaeon]
MAAPLDGLRIVEVSRGLPGSWCAALLADLGATVHKIEEPRRGDRFRDMPPRVKGRGAVHSVLDRHKRSVALNLRDPRGREWFLRLCERSDGLVEGMRPGAAEKLGLSYPEVRGRAPRLVYLTISGFGHGGPRGGLSSHDIDIVSAAGLAGFSGEPPRIPPVPMAAWSGALLGALGMLSALEARRRTGGGQHVDISMQDGIFASLLLPLGLWLATGKEASPLGNPLAGHLAHYSLYQDRDGRWLALGAVEPEAWEALCDLLGRPDLRPGFPPLDPALRETLAAEFRKRPRDEWLGLLRERDVPSAPVNTLREAARDPQILHRRMAADGPRGRTLGVPLRFSATSPRAPRGPPRLGEHTRETLRGLGATRAELNRLAREGVLKLG